MLKWIKEAKKISRWRPNGIKGNVTVPPFPEEKKKPKGKEGFNKVFAETGW